MSYKYDDEYLDLSELIDDKEYHKIPSVDNISPCIIERVVGRLMRVKNFTEEVASVIERLSNGCSLEKRIEQIIKYEGKIGAMKFYLDKGAPFELSEQNINIGNIHPLIRNTTLYNNIPNMKIEYYFGPLKKTLLSSVIDCNRSTVIEELDILLSCGADINEQSYKEYKTPLMECSSLFEKNWTSYGRLINWGIMRFLLERGADPLLEDKFGKNAIYHLQQAFESANRSRSLPPHCWKTMNELVDLLKIYA